MGFLSPALFAACFSFSSGFLGSRLGCSFAKAQNGSKSPSRQPFTPFHLAAGCLGWPLHCCKRRCNCGSGVRPSQQDPTLLSRTGACASANCSGDPAKSWQCQRCKAAWNSTFALSWEGQCHLYLKHTRLLIIRALSSNVLELLKVCRAYVYHIMHHIHFIFQEPKFIETILFTV